LRIGFEGSGRLENRLQFVIKIAHARNLPIASRERAMFAMQIGLAGVKQQGIRLKLFMQLLCLRLVWF
jgi:hypothetical protein